MVPGSKSRANVERILCPRCRATNRQDANFCIQCGTSLLLGKMYRIVQVIKEGGMGTVYRGIDQFGAPCALKELRDQFTDPQERESGIRRFLDEGRLLHSLQDHPAIPKVYRSFVDNGRYYLAMEFIQGEDMEDVLQRRGRFSEEQVLLWADQLCDVLQYLHDNGLIYRDMKPSNVMIARNGRVKVVDFGIAQILRPGHRGTMIGTPGYAPPEQYQGITTPQSDMYSLAATLHHMLTGRDPREHPPFTFPPAHTLNGDVSRTTSKALQKALQMEMEDRYPTVQAFRQALPIDELPQRPTRVIETVKTPPPQRSQRAQQARPATTAPRRQRSSFGTRVRRMLLAAMIGAGLLYTVPEWAPGVGATINDAFNSITERLDEGSSSTTPDRAATPAEVVAPPVSAAPEQSVAPSSSNAAVQEASPAPSTSPEQSTAPTEQVFRSVIEIEVPRDTPRDEIEARFEVAFLEEAREEFPGAQRGSGGLNVAYDPDDPNRGLQSEPAGDGQIRYKGEIVGNILIPNSQ
jgi:serine/threonine-protein kinase